MQRSEYTHYCSLECVWWAATHGAVAVVPRGPSILCSASASGGMQSVIFDWTHPCSAAQYTLSHTTPTRHTYARRARVHARPRVHTPPRMHAPPPATHGACDPADQWGGGRCLLRRCRGLPVLLCLVLSCVVLCCLVLFCVVLCCVMLCCVVLCCVVLCCVVLCCVCFALCCVVLCVALPCLVLCCVALCCVALCCVALCCVVLCCVVLRCGCCYVPAYRRAGHRFRVIQRLR